MLENLAIVAYVIAALLFFGAINAYFFISKELISEAALVSGHSQFSGRG